MAKAKTAYRVERRVANTSHWNVIDHAADHDEAIRKCNTGDRPLYAGVRIVPVTGHDEVDAFAEPEIVHGS